MPTITITEEEVEFKAIRSSGPGGQHVNKVATAIQIQFDLHASRLPEEVKARIAGFADRRISGDGVITITARRFRSQDANRVDALKRLNQLIQKALQRQKPRRATRPTRASVEKRLKSKSIRGEVKKSRAGIDPNSVD